MKGDFCEEWCAARPSKAVGAVYDLETACEAGMIYPSFISIAVTKASAGTYIREKYLF